MFLFLCFSGRLELSCLAFVVALRTDRCGLLFLGKQRGHETDATPSNHATISIPKNFDSFLDELAVLSAFEFVRIAVEQVEAEDDLASVSPVSNDTTSK